MKPDANQPPQPAPDLLGLAAAIEGRWPHDGPCLAANPDKCSTCIDSAVQAYTAAASEAAGLRWAHGEIERLRRMVSNAAQYIVEDTGEHSPVDGDYEGECPYCEIVAEVYPNGVEVKAHGSL